MRPNFATRAGFSILAGTLFGLSCLAETVIDETFEHDPQWNKIGLDGGGSSEFGWNSSSQSIAAPGSAASDGSFVRRNGWDAYVKPLAIPVTDQTAFTLKGDISMTSDVPYSRIYLGLFEQQASSAEERNAIYIERSRNPTQHYLKIYAVDQSGEEKLESKFFGLGKNLANQTVEVSYDPASRTLSWSVDGQSVEGITLPEGFHFSADACGVSNSRWSNGTTSYTATGQVDNVHLEVTKTP